MPRLVPLMLAAALAAAAGHASAAEGPTAPTGPAEGVASWYGAQFHGRRTANGEIFDKEKLSCAHRSLPFGTFLLVKNLDNGSSVVVRVNDRGPFAKNRILDLSEAAARLLGMLPTGTARVSFSILPPEEALAWKGGSLDGAQGGGPEAAAPRPEGQAAPASKPAASYRIQVASFRDEANALATIERLRASGLAATMESAGGYRRVVFLGLGEAEAKRIAERLAALGYRGCTVSASRPK